MEKKEKDDWYLFLHNFKSAKDSREKVIPPKSRDNETDSILESIITKLKSDKDEIFRISLLIFIQENVNYLVEDSKTMERICSTLNEFLTSNETTETQEGGVSFHLQSQVMITLTTILIELSVIRSQPRVFESFVEVCFDIVAKVNSGSDRMLRETACNCLQELEILYPCLLSDSLGHFLLFCQQETTHAIQAYLSLFATILEHSTIQFLEESNLNISNIRSKSSSFTLLSMANELCPFTIPPSVKYLPFPLNTSSTRHSISNKLPENTNKDVRKSIAQIMDNCFMLTSWGVLYVALRVLPFVHFSDLPKEVFMHHFWRLRNVHNPLLMHSLLLIKLNFPDIFTQQHENYLIDQLFSSVKDIWQSVEKRILILDWILYFPVQDHNSDIKSEMNTNSKQDNNGNRNNSDFPVFKRKKKNMLFSKYKLFYPTVFDSLELKHAKFRALSDCFDSNDPSLTLPSGILDILVCMDEFRFNKSNSFIGYVVFNTLFLFLSKYPQLVDQVYSFMLNVIITDPKFLPQVINTINLLSRDNTTVAKQMLMSFREVLTNIQTTNLVNYMPLIHAIVLDRSIDPSELCLALYRMLKTSSVRKTDWNIGNEVLGICRSILKIHSTVTLFRTVADILSFLSTYFDDLEIRDRSHFYYKLLTHVSGEKIKTILEDPQVTDNEEAVFMASPSSHSLKAKSMKKQSIVFLEFINSDLPPLPQDAFNTSSDKHEIMETEGLEVYRSYTQFISSSQFKPTIQKRYKLQFKHPSKRNVAFKISSSGTYGGSATSTPNSQLSNVVSDVIYSLVIQFGVSSIYASIPPIHIPYMANWSQTMENPPKNEIFPYSYDIQVAFQPFAPIPTSFQISITFNDHEGKITKGKMDSISLEFQDLFLPVFIPPEVKNKRTEYIISLFDQLWNKVLDLGQESISGDLKNGKRKGASSVKFIPMNWETMIQQLNSKLSKFLIPKVQQSISLPNSSIEEEEKVIQEEKILIFLPPSFHLLLRFNIRKDSTIVHIRTDFWRVLICLDDLFDSLKR